MQMFMSCFVELGYYVIFSMLGTTELLHVAMFCQRRVGRASHLPVFRFMVRGQMIVNMFFSKL